VYRVGAKEGNYVSSLGNTPPYSRQKYMPLRYVFCRIQTGTAIKR
jgi:hypothetical protein